MEKETEITKLVNVLKRTARMASQPHLADEADDVADHCAEQFNRILARLTILDSSVETTFTPLKEGSSLTVAAMACRQLAAYFEDEVSDSPDMGPGVFSAAYDKEGFKDFWRKGAEEMQDLGESLRECVQNWSQHQHPHRKHKHHKKHWKMDHEGKCD